VKNESKPTRKLPASSLMEKRIIAFPLRRVNEIILKEVNLYIFFLA
jgi:hypothetical protein